MSATGRTAMLVGLDIGRVNTRVSVFGVREGKYCLLGCEQAATAFGHDGHLAAGVHEALEKLEYLLDRKFRLPPKEADEDLAINQQTVGQVGLTLSAFPKIRAALFSLTACGSLSKGLALAAKLPIDLVGAYGLADLANEVGVIEQMIHSRPELLILTGGTDLGAEKPLARWVEVANLVCRVLPENARPIIFFAGNPELDSLVRRRLEPNTRLVMLPNLQPAYGERDDIPLQLSISREIVALSAEKLAGLQGLSQLAGSLVGVRGAMLDRMVRFISRLKDQRLMKDNQRGILALDLGAASTMVIAGWNGQSDACRIEAWHGDVQDWQAAVDGPIFRWTAAPVSREAAGNEIANQRLFPGRIPQTLTELALSQSLARHRIRTSMAALAEITAGLSFDITKGLMRDFGTIIASGAALTGAPTPGQAMLILLDGLQPWHQTDVILDRNQILPMLGLLGEAEPLLPVHVLNSDAFENLGTVIPVISGVQEGVMLVSITVAMDSGKTYTVDIPQGALRRLIVAPGESATLSLEPIPSADVGAGPGVNRRVRLTGGELGVVIDARGRPLVLPEEDEERIERIRHWLWSLGG